MVSAVTFQCRLSEKLGYFNQNARNDKLLLVFVSENYNVLSLHLSSLIQLEGLCGTKCKKTTSDSLIRRLPPFISQDISIIGHYVLCNITLRDKSGDAIRNQSQFVHRN